MICPNCKNEVKENAKFCTKCGFHLISDAVAAEEVKKEEKTPVCSCCGAPLKAGAKFCTKCGTAVTAVTAEAAPTVATAPTLAASTPAPKPMPAAPRPKPATAPERIKSDEPKKGSNVVLIVLIVLIIALIALGGYAAWNYFEPELSFGSLNNGDDGDTEAEYEDKDDADDEENNEAAGDAETADDAEAVEIDVDSLFAEYDELLATAYTHLENESEAVMAMESFEAAIDGFVETANQAGNADLAAGRVEEAYYGYFEATVMHAEIMNTSSLSSAIYAQVMYELENVIEKGRELQDNGYTIDFEEAKAYTEEFNESYRSKIIDTFDEFTTREAWSRTEAWNLLKDADGLYDTDDLNDPIRLRYCYALAWWTQKQIETELTSGTITQKGAAIKIAGLIEAMDYNPMMIDYYIQYMNNSGEDCSSVEQAYNEILEFIRDEQGIELGVDIDLAHFWYYNDISEPSQGVQDSYENGVLPEVREFIRERMRYAEFIK